MTLYVQVRTYFAWKGKVCLNFCDHTNQRNIQKTFLKTLQRPSWEHFYGSRKTVLKHIGHRRWWTSQTFYNDRRRDVTSQQPRWSIHSDILILWRYLLEVRCNASNHLESMRSFKPVQDNIPIQHYSKYLCNRPRWYRVCIVFVVYPYTCMTTVSKYDTSLR